MARMDGQVALVTGAASGIGAAIAIRLAAEGARVVAADVAPPQEFRLNSIPPEALVALTLDVTSTGDWAGAVDAAVEAFGGVDVLVNNAGIIDFGAVAEHSRQSWDRVLAVNLTGAFLGIQAVVPAMRNRGGGSIINISSIAGLRGYERIPAYTASKFGVRGLTKAAALDLAVDGIRVNAVLPGFIRTPMTEGMEPDTTHVAAARAGTPEEGAGLVAYLASQEAAYITGADFVIDGGETAGTAHNPVLEE
jgi:3alpha(or 20beta)-hydroxysteroid dehydrogenase